MTQGFTLKGGTEMTEQNQGFEPSDVAPMPSVLAEATTLLFRPGVQLRMTAAVLLCLFALFLPLMVMPFGAFLFLIPTIIFAVAPMLYGLAYMGEKAKNGETLSVRDLFIAFSKKYWYAIGSVLLWLLLLLLPVLLVVFCAVGAWAIYSLAVASPEVSDYSFFVLVFGAVVTFLSFLPALFLLCPAYFFLSLRVREEKLSIGRAVGLSVRLITKNSFGYFKLQLKYAGLFVLSCLSVCTLFPIYTIPLMVIATPVYLDRLIGAPTSENNIINIEDLK